MKTQKKIEKLEKEMERIIDRAMMGMGRRGDEIRMSQLRIELAEARRDNR